MTTGRPIALLLLALGACTTARPIDNSGLETEVSQLRERVGARVAPLLITDADWQVGVRGALLENMFRVVNSLPQDQRRITLRQNGSAQGFIASGSRGCITWHVELWPGRELSANASVLGTRAEWLPNATLQVTTDVSASASVPLRGHVRPCVGSGFGTNVATSGSVSTSLAAVATLAAAENGRIGYRLEGISPSRIPISLCVTLRHAGNLCQVAEVDPDWLGLLAEGEFELTGMTEGTLVFPAPVNTSRRYRLNITDTQLLTDANGITTRGRVSIEWIP